MVLWLYADQRNDGLWWRRPSTERCLTREVGRGAAAPRAESHRGGLRAAAAGGCRNGCSWRGVRNPLRCARHLLHPSSAAAVVLPRKAAYTLLSLHPNRLVTVCSLLVASAPLCLQTGCLRCPQGMHHLLCVLRFWGCPGTRHNTHTAGVTRPCLRALKSALAAKGAAASTSQQHLAGQSSAATPLTAPQLTHAQLLHLQQCFRVRQQVLSTLAAQGPADPATRAGIAKYLDGPGAGCRLMQRGEGGDGQPSSAHLHLVHLVRAG